MWNVRSYSKNITRAASLLLLSAVLSACSSSGKLPSANELEDLSTFRLSNITGSAATQASVTDTTRSRVTITFSARVFDNATTLIVPIGTRFSIYENDVLIGERAVQIEGDIRWQKVYEIEEGVIRDFETLVFRIEGAAPYRGTRTIRLKVNPSLAGGAAVVDITDGAVEAPRAVEEPRPQANGMTDNRPDFYIKSMSQSSSEPDMDSISPVTRTPTKLAYTLRACLGQLTNNRPAVRDNRKFRVRGFGMTDFQEVTTIGGGCVEFPASFSDFQFLSQERWFSRNVEICAENAELRNVCHNHQVYVNPWQTGGAFFFAGGQDLNMINRSPRANLIDGQIAREQQRPPRLHMNAYALNFVGRRFNINDNLSLSSQRNYDFVLKPLVERWTFNGYVPFSIEGGRFKVKLLLLKTHGDVADQFPATERGRAQFEEEQLCFSKDSPFDVVADMALRERCYARAFMDYVSGDVEARGGEIQFNTNLNFPDLRYIFSRNILMFELAPIEEGTPSGMPVHTFAGTFMPLEDAGRRLRNTIQQSTFVQYPERDLQGRVRYTLPELNSALNRWENETPLSSSDESILRSAAAGLRAGSSSAAIAELDASRSRDASSSPIHANERREIIMRSVREIRNQNKADNIDRIREIVERERGNVLSTDELQLEAAGMARNLPKIELYRRMNGLNFTQNISQQDLETVISAMEPRLNEVNQITEVEASIVDRPNVRAVLEKGCEAVFPDRTSEAAQREARENAAREFQNAMNAYASQRLVLCRLQAAINQRVYDNTELDPRALGGCEDTRPQCFYQRVTMADIGGGGFVARSLNWIMGSGQGRGSCSQEAPERYSLLMQGILSQDRNLIQRVLQQKDELERGVVEWLASQYLTQMPFTLIAAEAMHDLGQVPVRLSETILDPRRLDRRNPAHQAYIDRFTPRLAQDRCKRAPLEYLSVDFSEHVLRVIGEPRNTGAGSTNVTVFANISLGANESRDRTAGSSRSTHVDAGGKVSSGSQVAGQAGASFRVVGINAGQEVSIGTEKSLGTSQSWFVSDTVTRGEARSTSAGEGSSRTLNAEEISFRFNAETMKCLSFQPKERSLQVRPGGALVCQDQPSVREVNDTWYYVYLFFRNNNSPLHDSAADLQMRPWTLMIRGHDQFESFKLVLQNSALRLRLSPVRLPGPEAAMNQAFVTFQIDYRKLRDLPGLLSVKSLSWRTNVSAIRPSAGPVSNPAVPPAR